MTPSEADTHDSSAVRSARTDICGARPAGPSLAGGQTADKVQAEPARGGPDSSSTRRRDRRSCATTAGTRGNLRNDRRQAKKGAPRARRKPHPAGDWQLHLATKAGGGARVSRHAATLHTTGRNDRRGRSDCDKSEAPACGAAEEHHTPEPRATPSTNKRRIKSSHWGCARALARGRVQNPARQPTLPQAPATAWCTNAYIDGAAAKAQRRNGTIKPP